MLLIVVPHRGSAYLFKSSDSDIWVRESTPSQELTVLLGCSLPPQESHSKRNKLQEAKRQNCSFCSPGCRPNRRGHSNPPFGQKITCLHPWRQLDSSGLGRRCWKQKRKALYVPKNSHSQVLEYSWSTSQQEDDITFKISHMLVFFMFITEWSA